MKPKLILMSHGNMAYETLQSAQMITGVLDDIYVVSMGADDGLDGTKEKYNAVLKELGDMPAIVAVDLFGGTPFNVASMTSLNDSTKKIITGLNLAMVIEYSVSTIENVSELANQLLDTGRMAVQTVGDDDDDCEIDE